MSKHDDNLFEIVPALPRADTIKYFEDLLQRAQTGEIQGFAIVLQKDNGGTANGWAGIGNNCMVVVGEIEAMKVDLIRSNVDQRYDCCGDEINA